MTKQAERSLYTAHGQVFTDLLEFSICPSTVSPCALATQNSDPSRKERFTGRGAWQGWAKNSLWVPAHEWLRGLLCPTCAASGDGRAHYLQCYCYVSPPLDTQTAFSDLMFRDQIGVLGAMRIQPLHKVALLWMFWGVRGGLTWASHPSAHWRGPDLQ